MCNLVYCIECEYLGYNVEGYDECRHPKNVELSRNYLQSFIKKIWAPTFKNKNNNCELFQQKKSLLQRLIGVIKGV